MGNEEHGYFIAFGRYRISEKYKTELDAILALESEKWNILLNWMITFEEINRHDEERNSEKK